jgi:hypothetical protein
VGNWPNYALNALVYLEARHSKRSISSKGVKRVKVLYIRLDYLISKQLIIVESSKISVM